MKSIAFLLCLVATVASAQEPDAPTAPPPPPSLAPAPPDELPPPPAPPTPGATGPAESPGERAIRYSRFSAGRGGALFAFTEVISGVVSGAMLGHAYDKDNPDETRRSNSAYTGAVLGGLMMGTAATLYQYAIPVERNEAFLASGAAAAGFMGGLAISINSDMSSQDRAWLTLGTTQLGVITVLALTSGAGDVSKGDAALVGMVSLYAFMLTGLTQYIIDASASGDTNLTPTFVAPAVGMALGALLAIQLDLDASRVVKLTLVPLGVGVSMLWLGSILADGTTVPLTAMAGIVTSFALTVLLTSDPGVPTERDSMRRADFQAVPVPVVIATGRDKSSLAAGPGLFVRF
jgi:hypothetical protein